MPLEYRVSIWKTRQESQTQSRAFHCCPGAPGHDDDRYEARTCIEFHRDFVAASINEKRFLLWRSVDGPCKWRYSDASGASGPLFCEIDECNAGIEGGRGDRGDRFCGVEASGVASARGVPTDCENGSGFGEDRASVLAPRSKKTQRDGHPFALAAQATPEEERVSAKKVGVITGNAEGKEELEEIKLEEAVIPEEQPHASLFDDDDFLEAMEDVHSWLGKILDQ